MKKIINMYNRICGIVMAISTIMTVLYAVSKKFRDIVTDMSFAMSNTIMNTKIYKIFENWLMKEIEKEMESNKE